MTAEAGDGPSRPERPLALNVLDLSSEIAGPYATKLLADAGASVWKVEPPAGDPLRRWSASGARPESEDGALFQFLNAGKRSLVLDLDAPADRERLLELASAADLLVEDFGPGGLARRDLAIERLQKRRPSLSVVSISPWGATGPWADRPATEWTLQAAIGMTARRGLPQRGPVGCGGRVGEWVAGSYAAVGAICAVLSSFRTGAGQHVDLSMFESMLLCMTQYHDFAGQLFGTPLPQYVDTPSIEPAKDGWVGFATITAQQWKDFCALVERPDLAEIKRYFHTDERMKDLDFIHGMIRGWTRERTVDEIVELASAMRIPVSPIGDGENLPRTDHFVARGVFERHPGGFVAPRVPYRLDRVPARVPAAAPRLGEHAKDPLWAPIPREPRGGGPLPFEGLRVVDLSAFWAGPFVTTHLAAMGADVVKVESIQRPDGYRFTQTFAQLGEDYYEHSSTYQASNLGKRNLTLDLSREEGRALFRRLATTADVVLENFSPRVIENFGFDYDRLTKLKPDVILIRMPGFGLEGPWRDYVGWALVIEQVTGMSWITGHPDGPPLGPGGFIDCAVSMHAGVALQAALFHRDRTGEGQLIELAQIETGACLTAEQVIDFSMNGRVQERTGNRDRTMAPQGAYPCREEAWVALSVRDDGDWKRLVEVVGSPSWATSPDLATSAGRRARHDELDERLAAWTREQDADELVRSLRAAGLPAARCLVATRMYGEPHLEARGYYQEIEHPRSGLRRYPVWPLRFSFGPEPHYRASAPTLGQHNDEILGGELGLSTEELAKLREDRIIGDRMRR